MENKATENKTVEKEIKIKKKKWHEHNIYKVGTAKYYKDTIDNIDMIIVGYDGYDPKKAKSMRKLLEAIYEMSGKALRHEKMYWGEV